MSDATLNDVIARLDRLEAALSKIADAIKAAGESRAAAPVAVVAAPPAPVAAVAATAAVPVATAPAGPPLVRVAPPARTVPSPATPTRDASAPARPGEEPKRDFNPYRDRTDLVVPGAEASVTDMLTFLFGAVQSAEIDDMWGLLYKATHSSQLQGPRSIDHFKAFSWHKARRSAGEYLDASKNPASFQIAYTEPAEIGPNVERVRVFVSKADGKMPAPVVFARDPKDNNAWRIAQLSI